MKYTVYISAVRKRRRKLARAWGRKRQLMAQDLTTFVRRHQEDALNDWYNQKGHV
jgi:hypothetical protein